MLLAGDTFSSKSVVDTSNLATLIMGRSGKVNLCGDIG
jgi:hypothetical protein